MAKMYIVKQKGVPTQEIDGKALIGWAESYYKDYKSFWKSTGKNYTSDVYSSVKKAIDFLEKEFQWEIIEKNSKNKMIEYRVSRKSSTQGMYFETDKGDDIAVGIGRIMWINKYGPANDITIQEWKPRGKFLKQ